MYNASRYNYFYSRTGSTSRKNIGGGLIGEVSVHLHQLLITITLIQMFQILEMVVLAKFISLGLGWNLWLYR
jgi:hypothetical protein